MPKTMEAPAKKQGKKVEPADRMLSVKQMAAWWGVSRRYIWELATKRKGKNRLPSYKLGVRRLFSYEECQGFLKARRDN